MSPLLSLIIPTRERARTLRWTLQSAVGQSSGDYEIVVSDNASADGTRDVVEGMGDRRIRYLQTGNRLSMCDNYEFALDQARGDYVLIIGDDDAVVPAGIDVLLARLRAIEQPTIHMWPLHIYDWPVDGGPAKVAYLAPILPPSRLDMKAKAREVIGLGGWKYYELPSPYHSAVPREMLLKIKDRTGRVFNSTQPDVFTAMALPAFTDVAINLGCTISLNGRSARSNGLGFVKQSARVNIDRFIGEYGDYKFHPSLWQKAPAAVNMIPDAVLMARDRFPDLYDGVNFNYSAMWAYVSRIGFYRYGDVLRHHREISAAHPFKVSEYLRFAALHRAAVLRRRFLDEMTRRTRLHGPAPSDIWRFVSELPASVASRPA